MSSEDKKREAIDRIANRMSQRSNLTHKQAKDFVIKQITKAENKRR